MTLTVIKTPQQSANESTVDVLERLLEDAKNGEVESVFVIAIRADGKYRSIASTHLDRLRELGAIETIKHDMLNE